MYKASASTREEERFAQLARTFPASIFNRSSVHVAKICKHLVVLMILMKILWEQKTIAANMQFIRIGNTRADCKQAEIKLRQGGSWIISHIPSQAGLHLHIVWSSLAQTVMGSGPLSKHRSFTSIQMAHALTHPATTPQPLSLTCQLACHHGIASLCAHGRSTASSPAWGELAKSQTPAGLAHVLAPTEPELFGELASFHNMSDRLSNKFK